MARKKKSDHSADLAPKGEYTGQRLRKITFAGGDSEGVLRREVRGAEITGFLAGDKTAPACNVVESVLQTFTAKSVDFKRCDFKDNAIRGCSFIGCNFGSSSFAYNAIINSQFENCSFPDTAFLNCDFYDTLFLQCDLRNVLIKNCSFTRCDFRDCETNNKVFETSRFVDSSFHATELQVQTIEDNFGITANRYEGTLRNGRGDASHQKVTETDLRSALQLSSLHPLKKLSIDYFIRGSLLDGSTFLDASLAFESWESLSQNPGSFAVALSQWVDFMLSLYERDEIMVHTVIGLHTLTSRLSQALFAQASRHQALTMFSAALTMIDGAHTSLARALEPYLSTVERLAVNVRHEIALLVEGDHPKSYYREKLSPLFERADGEIVALRPYNSPWEMIIALGQNGDITSAVAVFLASRVRLQLFRISERANQQHTRQELTSPAQKSALVKSDFLPALPSSAEVTQIFALDMSKLQMMAYFPAAQLIVLLNLNIPSIQMAQLRKMVRDWLLRPDDSHDVGDSS